MFKKILIGLIVLGLVLGTYFFCNRQAEAEPEYKIVTAKVELGVLKADITSSGTLKPLVEVLVGSQVSGYIKELFADFESTVKKGELIAVIDPAIFKAKAEQARADVEAAKASLAKSKVTAEDEVRNFKRKEQLITNHSISQSEFDTAEMKAAAAQAEVKLDQAKVAQMEAKLKEAELQLNYTQIVAPVDGIVTSRSMDVGQTVTASFQTPVLFKIAEDLTRMQVHTNVDEADIGRVQVGQKADFTVPAFPDVQFNAVVTQIRNDPKVEQNVVTYNVILEVENKNLKLRPGMTANVQIHLTEVPNALMVPDQALRFNPPEALAPKSDLQPLKTGQRRLWKLIEPGQIKPIVVAVGISGMERIQIVSKEIKDGDKVAIEATSKKKSGASKGSSGIRFRF